MKFRIALILSFIFCVQFIWAQTLLGPGNLVDNGVSGYSVQVVEVNQDGNIDLVVVKSSNLVFYANNGSGVFSPATTIVASSSLHYAFADIDADGDNDLVYYNNDELRWINNNGSGTFVTSTLIDNIANNVTSTFNSMLVLEDLDNDSDQDIILVTNTDNTDDSDDEILYYLNNGSGSFSAANVVSTSERYIEDIKTADLDGDGNQDIVFASSDIAGIASIKYFKNNGSANFSSLTTVNTGLLGQDIYIDIADYNTDGNLDVLASSSNSENIILFVNNGASFSQNIVIDDLGQGPADAIFIDLNNNGFVDVVSGFNAGLAASFTNVNGVSFTSRQNVCLDDQNTVKIEKGDFNNDGDIDLVATKFFGNQLYWIENIPLFAEVSVNNLPCINSCNGSLLVEVCAPYVPPFSYQWNRDGGVANGNGTAASQEFTIENLCEGSYDVTITDAQGNSYVESAFVLNELTGNYFEISGITTTNSSNAQSNGAILIELAGGSPNYTYSWSGPVTGSQSLSANSFTISNLPAGTYTITVLENDGASQNYMVTVLDENAPVTTCDHPLDIIILNDVSGSVDPLEYTQAKQFFVDFANSLNIGTTAADSRMGIIEWSGTGEQNVVVPFTGNIGDLQNYSNATRVYSGGTNPQDAFRYGVGYLAVAALLSNNPRVIVLATDANQGQVSGSLIALANQYKSLGYYIVTIAFDEAFMSPFVSAVLQEAASSDGLVYGASTYAELNNTIAETIVNLYVCPVGPGASNSVFFDRDGAIDISSVTVNGNCPNPTSVDVEFVIFTNSQLAIPPGTPVTFYYNDPRLFGSTPILTYYIPCAVTAGSIENFTVTLPINTAANIYAVLNDDGSQSPPILFPNSFPITDIEETNYINNFDAETICFNAQPTLSAIKYTSTPIPVCDNVVIYNVDVCNISSFDANDVVVNDIAPTGSVLISSSVNDNGCSSGNTSFNIPAGCCVSVIYSYDVSGVADGIYNDQDAIISGPANQNYISFDGATSAAEDVTISNTINCPSDAVTFTKSPNVTEICEESFVTFTFTIDNQTSVDIFNLDFIDNLPAPVIWAAEPYLLEGLSIGQSNITGSQNANFTIDAVEANTIATFQMDAYLGDWANNGVLTNSATITNWPSFVNGNGSTPTATATSVDVYVLPTVDAVNLVQINSDELADLQSTIVDGINPMWVSDGDGTFVDANIEDATYIPGPQDIEDGVVNFTISAESALAQCGDALDTVRLEITKVYDFGDAPDIYKTTLASNGAQHFLTYNNKNAFYLGSNNIDDEIDGLPVNNGLPAINDDNTENNDEDGISMFPTLSVDMSGSYIVPIQAQNSYNFPSYLYGWIDFNRDGQWTTDEFASVEIPANSMSQLFNLPFDLPNNLDAGITYARFRITTLILPDIGSTIIDERSFGFVTNGEVEDYDIIIEAREICDNGIDDDGDGDIDMDDDDCALCKANFSVSNICVYDSFTFDGLASSTSGAAIITDYNWNFGDGSFSSDSVANHQFATAGDYDVLLVIEDDSSCVDSTIMTITIHPKPIVNFQPVDDICLNVGVTTLNEGQPAGGDYFGNGIVNNNMFNPEVAGIGNHEIDYIFTDVNGCVDTASSNIEVHSLPNVTLDVFDDLCLLTDPITLNGGNPIGGLYEGNGVVGNQFDPAITGVGNFDIQYSFADVNGCSDTIAGQIEVLDALIDTTVVTICDEEFYTLPNGAIVSTPDIYSDTISNGSQCDEIIFTDLRVSTLNNDTINVVLCGGSTYELSNGDIISTAGFFIDSFTTNNNCDSVIYTNVEVDETICLGECDLIAPTAFTPDKDLINDDFYIIPICQEVFNSFNLSIYNRWGELVFESKNIEDGWDGSYKNVNAPMDVYSYIVRFNRERVGEEELLYGVVVLIR